MYSSSYSDTTISSENVSTLLINQTLSTPLADFNRKLLSSSNWTSSSLINNVTDIQTKNLTCHQIKYAYITQKPLFNIVRYITHNQNRFFILPATILNLCAFYILRRTRMNRSSSIAFYMQALALCDVAFFALRVIFAELSSSTAGKQILTTGLCKFLFLMMNAVNYTTVWLIAAMNVDKFLAVCLPLRVSDLLSRRRAYGVVIAVIIFSMLVASVHATRTVLKDDSYCWLKTPEDEKVVFILDAFVWCFIPFFVISILNGAIFLALFRARREASQLNESTRTTNSVRNQSTSGTNFLRAQSVSSVNKTNFQSTVVNVNPNNRNRIQSQNLQITIMLITISISFFVLTLPNAIYYLLIFFRVLIESWKVVKCDENLHRNLDVYVRTSAVMYLVSHITSDLMHVVNFFLYFISGARFRSEFRRLIFYQLCPSWCKQYLPKDGKESLTNERSFARSSAAVSVRTVTGVRTNPSDNKRTSMNSYIKIDRDNRQTPTTNLSSRLNRSIDGNHSVSIDGIARRNICTPITTSSIGSENEIKADIATLLPHQLN